MAESELKEEKINTKDGKKNRSVIRLLITGLVSLLYFSVFLLVLFAMIMKIHTDRVVEEVAAKGVSVNLSSGLETYYENAKIDILSDYLSENEVMHKIYKIEEGMSVPLPSQECYGTFTYDEAAGISDIYAKALKCGLIDEGEMIFDPDSENLASYAKVNYYYDDSILVIIWKEYVDNHEITYAEVKIGDPSQIRRKLAGDKYGSSAQYYCSELTGQANAVIGMNADFYAFRSLGTTCYDGTIYRTNNTLDTLFIDENGDFVFLKRGFDLGKEELQQYADSINADFAISFGPALIENGELLDIKSYPIGEINETYSRAGIGQLSERHYLYMTVGYGKGTVMTLPEFAGYMYEKGVVMGYNLDGGQTGELVMNGKIYNSVDFGNERSVSDIIYFATAIGEPQ